MDVREVAGWLFLLLVVAIISMMAVYIRRVKRRRPEQDQMVMLLASLSATATTHREICRLLISEGKHHECGLCHAPDNVQQWVAAHQMGWLHMVAMAQHPSWLDWDVSISRIVIEQFRQGTGREQP